MGGMRRTAEPMRVIRLEPETLYSEYELVIQGWDEGWLARSRREGLRYTYMGRARYYMGAWLQEWLSREAE
jgi:hypothetical protein